MEETERRYCNSVLHIELTLDLFTFAVTFVTRKHFRIILYVLGEARVSFT